MIYFPDDKTHAALRPPDTMSQTFFVRPKMRLHMISLAMLAGWGTCAYGLGFGPIAVQSSLTQPFSASVPVYGLADAGAANCVKTRLQNPDGTFLSRGTARITASGKDSVIELGSSDSVNEPALRVEVVIGCTTPIKGIFDVLLDPALPGNVVAANAAKPVRPKKTEPNFTLPLPIEPSVATLPPVRNPSSSMLKLGGPELVAERVAAAGGVRPTWELKSDFVLSLSRKETSEDQMQMWRKAQSRLAAELRGEDVVEDLSQRVGAAEQQAQKLKKDNLLTAQRSAAEKTAMQEEMDKRFAPAWVFSLGAIALACLGGIGFIGYKRRPRKESTPWHQATEPHLNLQRVMTPVESAAVSAVAPSMLAPDMEFLHPQPVEMDDAQKDAESLRHAVNLDAEMAQCAADVAGILCDAEHWMAEQDPTAAIAALEPYFRGKQHSPAPALYLLELYRALGNEGAYAEVRAQVAVTFKVLTPGWTVDWMQEARSVATFPAIREAIDSLHKSPELLPLLQGLLLVDDSRFDFNVYRDIVREIIRAVEPPPVAATPTVVEEVAPVADEPVAPAPHVEVAPQPIVPMDGAPLLEDDLFAPMQITPQGEIPGIGSELRAEGNHLPLLPELASPGQPGAADKLFDESSVKPHFELPDLDFPMFKKPDSPRMH